MTARTTTVCWFPIHFDRDRCSRNALAPTVVGHDASRFAKSRSLGKLLRVILRS